MALQKAQDDVEAWIYPMSSRAREKKDATLQNPWIYPWGGSVVRLRLGHPIQILADWHYAKSISPPKRQPNLKLRSVPAGSQSGILTKKDKTWTANGHSTLR